VGDSYYGNQDDASIDMTMLQSFLAYDCSIVVDGHSPPSSPDEIRQYLAAEQGKPSRD
jgi:hypothetical protein